MPLVTSGTATTPPLPVVAVDPGPSRLNHVSIVKVVALRPGAAPNVTRSSRPSKCSAVFGPEGEPLARVSRGARSLSAMCFACALSDEGSDQPGNGLLTHLSDGAAASFAAAQYATHVTTAMHRAPTRPARPADFERQRRI